MRIASMGHAVFAVVLIAIGVLGLISSEYAAIWNGVPEVFPGRDALLYLCAVVALACGLGLVWPRTAARVLLAYFLVWTLIFKGQFILLEPTQEVSYQSFGENAVVVAAAWVLYVWFAADWDRQRLGFATGDGGIRIARLFYVFAMFAFGLSHFFYLQFTAPLVPDWLPWHVGWAYFTGAAYLAAGAAILFGVYARLAVMLSVAQMTGFLLLVWLPRVAAGTMSAFNWGELVVNCMLIAGGWVVMDSYRGLPWLAVGKYGRADKGNSYSPV